MDKNEKPEIGLNGGSIPEESEVDKNATNHETDTLADESAQGVEEMLKDDAELPADDPKVTRAERDVAKRLEQHFEGKNKKALESALKMVASRIRPDPNKPRKNRWLVKDILPWNGTGLLHGRSGCRKSFILLDMLIKLAFANIRYNNTYACEGDIKQCGITVYIAAENPGSQHYRTDAFMAKYGFSCVELAERFWLIADPPNLASPEYIEGLLGFVQNLEDETGIPVTCVAIDTFIKSVSGIEESNNTDVGRVLNQLSGINNKLAQMGKGCTFIVAHHHGKGKVSDGQPTPRGAQAFTDSVDFSLWAEKLDTPYLATRLTPSKHRDGDDEENIIIRFDKIDAPPDEDGDIDTTLVVKSVNWEKEDERNQALDTSIAAREADEKRRAEQSTKRHKFTSRDTRKQNCWQAVQSLAADNIAITKESTIDRLISLYGKDSTQKKSIRRFALQDLKGLVEWNYLTEQDGTFYIRDYDTTAEDVIPGFSQNEKLDPEKVKEFRDNLGTVFPNKIVSNQEVEFATDEDLDDENVIEGEVV